MNQDNKASGVGRQLSDALKRAAKALCMLLALWVVGALSYLNYLKSKDVDELIVAIIGWLMGLFFMWIFIAKKEEWLKEKINDFF